MAQLQSTGITGSFNICNENTDGILNTSPGNWWYNPSTGKLNYTRGTATKAWSIGGGMTLRCCVGGTGTQNAGLAFGGQCTYFSPYGPYSVSTVTTQEYNGAVWQLGGNMIVARYGSGGAGTQNEGLAIGGLSACTEEYNGSSWSAGGALIIARTHNAGAGTQNLGLTFGGNSINSCTEEYNGTSWSAGGALIVARELSGGAGTQNAGLAFGGQCSVYIYPDTFYCSLACTEEYDGSTWSTGGVMINCRYTPRGAGTQNEALIFGGAVPGFGVSYATEEYNGSSWSSTCNMIYNRFYHAGAGSQARALTFGNFDCTACITEEFNINYNSVGVL